MGEAASAISDPLSATELQTHIEEVVGFSL